MSLGIRIRPPHGSIPTYYGRPAIKAGPYSFVLTYVFIGALAAGLQIAVTAAELMGFR
jgi:hypothetical protein